MKEHLETVKTMLDGRLPGNIIADAGYEKVKIEWGLHCTAHNTRKIAAMMG